VIPPRPTRPPRMQDLGSKEPRAPEGDRVAP
jgi:hypothetical protein